MARNVVACVLLLFMAPVLLSSDRVPASPRSSSGDCKQSWDDPLPLLDPQGRPVYLGRPQFAATRKGVAVLGNDAVVWSVKGSRAEVFEGSPKTTPLAGFLLSGGGHATSIAGPGTERFLDPLVVSDPTGIAHVIWGTSSNPTTDRREWRVDRLWYARFDGSQWTAPSQLTVPVDSIAHTKLQWNPVSPALAYAPDGELYIAEPRAHAVFLYRRNPEARWTTTHYPLGASYVALHAFGRGRLVLVYAGGIRPTTRRAGRWDRGVLATTSNDGGATWTEPVIIQSAGRGEAHAPSLWSVRDSLLYLVWVQLVAGRAMPDSVLLATSGDRGRTWQRERGLNVAGGIVDIASATDRHATTHVAALTQVMRGKGEALVTARWVHGRWTRGPEFEHASSPHQFGAVGDSLILAWTRAPRVGLASIPTLVVTTFRPCSSR